MKVNVKLEYSKLYENIKAGISSFQKNNPSNDLRYPMENYIASQVSHFIELEICKQNNIQCNHYKGWKFVDFGDQKNLKKLK